MVVGFDDVKLNIEEPILAYFFDKNEAGETIIKDAEWGLAEAKVTAQLRKYVPCFSEELLALTNSAGEFLCKDLLTYWAILFNYANQNLANEMTENGYSEIKERYDAAIKYLEDNGASYCSNSGTLERVNPLINMVKTSIISGINYY